MDRLTEMGSGVKKRVDPSIPSDLPWGLALSGLIALVVVFTMIVGWVSFSLRNETREQLMSRDAYVLNMLVQNGISNAEEEESVFEFPGLRELDIWDSLLQTASAREVFAAQLFSATGELLYSSSSVLVLDALPDRVLEKLESGESYSEFREKSLLSEFVDIGFSEDLEISTLSVFIPLHSANGENDLWVARYLLDGRALSEEFVLLDQRLGRQAAIAVGIGSVLIFGLFGAAWWRLKLANARILQHAIRLKKANSELAMLARTSAVGSVTAHLIHGLKNPLAGLREVVNAQSGGSRGYDEEQWRGATEAANRMQKMVEEVVELLQDSASGASYDVELGELRDEIDKRFRARVEGRGITFINEYVGTMTLDSHRSNIVLLVVENLIQNASDVLGTGDRITVESVLVGDELRIRVSDTGPGVDESTRERLFQPGPSGKSGGAGIGLAISLQMTRHIGGTLQYVNTDDAGAVFELVVPVTEEDWELANEK